MHWTPAPAPSSALHNKHEKEGFGKYYNRTKRFIFVQPKFLTDLKRCSTRITDGQPGYHRWLQPSNNCHISLCACSATSSLMIRLDEILGCFNFLVRTQHPKLSIKLSIIDLNIWILVTWMRWTYEAFFFASWYDSPTHLHWYHPSHKLHYIHLCSSEYSH